MQAFDAVYRPDAPPATFTQRFRGDTGGFTLVRIEKSTPTLTLCCSRKKTHAARSPRAEVTDIAKRRRVVDATRYARGLRTSRLRG